MNFRKLREHGWSVYPNMLVKEQEYPYAKCVVALNDGKVKRIYWSCVRAPDSIKEKFLSELEECRR